MKLWVRWCVVVAVLVAAFYAQDRIESQRIERQAERLRKLEVQVGLLFTDLDRLNEQLPRLIRAEFKAHEKRVLARIERLLAQR